MKWTSLICISSFIHSWNLFVFRLHFRLNPSNSCRFLTSSPTTSSCPRSPCPPPPSNQTPRHPWPKGSPPKWQPNSFRRPKDPELSFRGFKGPICPKTSFKVSSNKWKISYWKLRLKPNHRGKFHQLRLPFSCPPWRPRARPWPARPWQPCLSSLSSRSLPIRLRCRPWWAVPSPSQSIKSRPSPKVSLYLFFKIIFRISKNDFFKKKKLCTTIPSFNQISYALKVWKKPIYIF